MSDASGGSRGEDARAAAVHLRASANAGSVLPTAYERLGGMPVFERIVTRFYDGVHSDEVLWPMYPADDLEGAIWRLSRFLAQFFGGPADYSARRGHPRLRMRHAAFHVNPDARDRWLLHMTRAIRAEGLAPADEGELLDYVNRAAHALVNTFEPTPPTQETP